MNSMADRSKGGPLPRVRRISHRSRVGIVLVVILTLIGEGRTGWAAADEVEGPPRPPPQWRVSATVNYSSGSYGTDSRTNILYAPMTVRRIFRDGDISLTIPFVSISGTGVVRLVGGAPTRTGSSGGSIVGNFRRWGRAREEPWRNPSFRHHHRQRARRYHFAWPLLPDRRKRHGSARGNHRAGEIADRGC